MKRILFFIITIIVAVILTGCGTQKPAAFKTVHDTAVVERIVNYRDTVFKTPPAQASASAPCNQLSETPKISKSGNATVSLSKDKQGNVVADCHCDTLAIKAKIKSELQKETKTTVITETQIQKEKYTPFLVKVLAWIGGIFTALIATGITVKFIKNKIK